MSLASTSATSAPVADPHAQALADASRLAQLVVKVGVGLGGLRDDQRLAALGLAACCLPLSSVCTEAQVNALLKAWLADEGRFLDVDHVELRRWLVDTGWWQRDGFGRAYERTPAPALRPALLPCVRALHAAAGGADAAAVKGWVAAQREAAAHARARRAQDWQQRTPGQVGNKPLHDHG